MAYQSAIFNDLYPANPENDKGKRTWEWDIDVHQIVVCRRQTGESGTHFHKGDDPAKNPEHLLLIQGVIACELLNREGDRRSELLDASSGPIEITIIPWILHRMTAVTDCIYIEYRGENRFNQEYPDTYPEEDFPCQFQYPLRTASAR